MVSDLNHYKDLTHNVNNFVDDSSSNIGTTILTDILNYKTRLCFMNSFVIGKLQYMLPLLLSALKDLVHKVHLIYMKAAKVVLNFNTFKKSN